MDLYIRYLSNCFCWGSFFSLTEICVVQESFCLFDRSVFLWRKLGQNFFFCDWNFFSRRNFFFDNFFCQKVTFISDINFVLWRKFCLCQEIWLCYITLFLWQKLVLSKIPNFGDFICDFQGKVSVRNKSFRYLTRDTHFVEPWVGAIMLLFLNLEGCV